MIHFLIYDWLNYLQRKEVTDGQREVTHELTLSVRWPFARREKWKIKSE